MKPRTAGELAARVRRPGPRARRALRRLIRHGDRGDQEATDAVWDLWFIEGDPQLWEALRRWRRPCSGRRGGESLVALGEQAPAEAVVAAATWNWYPHAATARAAILAGDQELVDAVCEAALATKTTELTGWCVEHHLAPADPHRAAVFFLLTGQLEQYRLVDPDHALLVAAYRGAGPGEQARIRAAAVGESEVIRTLAGAGRDRAVWPDDAEVAYLIDAVAGRQDWAGLWELAKGLPVTGAVAAVHRYEGARPSGTDEDLFALLAAANPAELAAAKEALTGSEWIHCTGCEGSALAPNRRWVALRTTGQVDLYALPRGRDGSPAASQGVYHAGPMVTLDDGAVVVASPGNLVYGKAFLPSGSVGHAPREDTPIYAFCEARALGTTAAGFAALTAEGDQLRLHLVSGKGHRLDGCPRRALDLRAQLGISASAELNWLMATDPASGRFAFAGDQLYLAELDGDGLRLLATAPMDTSGKAHLAFSGAHRLLGVDGRNVLRIWQPRDDTLPVLAERQLTDHNAVDLPVAGLVFVIDRAGPDRRLRCLDGVTLADVGMPATVKAPAAPTFLFGSADGTCLGVGTWTSAHLLDAGPGLLVDRSLAATTPADLLAVQAVLASPATPTAARPLLTLFQACLALGDGGPAAARDHDTALGEQA